MRIVVTGALGHIGSFLVRYLPKVFNNPEIVMIDDLSTQRYCSLFDLPRNARFQFHESKVQNIDLVALVRESDVVIHLAAITDAAGTADKPELVETNNLSATKAVAQACLTCNVPLIFPSTTSVYGSQSTRVDETCADLKPQSPYAETKIKEETCLEELSKRGLKMAIVRFGTIYGVSPGMRFHTAVNKFCWQAVMGQDLTVWETAMDQFRPYLWLQDAAAAVAWIVQKNLYDSAVSNVVSGNHTVRQVLDEIRKYVPDLRVSLVQHKIMNQLSYEVSAEKFSKTGFRFTGTLADGISQTMKMIRLPH